MRRRQPGVQPVRGMGATPQAAVRGARRLTVVVRGRQALGECPARTPLTYKEAKKRGNVSRELTFFNYGFWNQPCELWKLSWQVIPPSCGPAVGCKSYSKENPSRAGQYAHIAGNLYMVLTPLKAGASQSTIEDCFADEIRTLNLGGKAFNPHNKADPNLHFGKHILSQHVREHAAKVDFRSFAELLDRITVAIEAHQSKQAVVAAQGVN
jgi:hypothetical protein